MWSVEYDGKDVGGSPQTGLDARKLAHEWVQNWKPIVVKKDGVPVVLFVAVAKEYPKD